MSIPGSGPREAAGLRATESGQPPNVVLLVVNSDREPVGGATVARQDVDRIEVLGRADGAGVFEGRVPDALGQALIVEAEGYARVHRDVSELPVRETIVLDSGWQVHGLVVDERDRPLEGMRVIAWPAGRAPSGRVIASHVLSQPVLAGSGRDSGGRFQLSGLDRAQAYELVAGGAAYVQGKLAEVLPYTQDAIVVRLSRLYGARLRVTARGGGPPVVSTAVGTVDCTHSRYPMDRIRPLSFDHPSALLSRPVATLLASGFEATPHDQVKLYAVSENEGEVPPISYTYCVAGYEPVRGELALRPVLEAIAEVPLVVEPLAAGFAQLEIEILGLPDERPFHTAREAPLYLFARNVPCEQDYVLRLPMHARAQLPGLVPAGLTRFALEVEEWKSPDWSRPIAEIELEPDRPGVLTVDLRAYGGARIELLDADGRELHGPVRLGVATAEDALVRYASFDRGPYCIYGLTGGDYYVTVQGPSAQGASGPSRTPVFSVVPGELTVTTCAPEVPTGD